MALVAEIISVGTELLLGEILNTNAQFLARELSGLGFDVYFQTVVGDNPARLRAAAELARSRADLIITTGGLGPTCDDLTRQTLAECFGKKLVFDEESARRIREYFAQSGRAMTENNLQQADLPQDCTVLENRWGTAPGCLFEAEGCRVLMLPGPPAECCPMFLEEAVPHLRALTGATIRSRALRVFGPGEAEVESLLRSRMNALTNPTLAPYAKVGEVELRITAKGPDPAACDALIAPVEEELRGILGDFIYGADEDSLESVTLAGLKARGLTFGCAESCTGGLIAKRMTDLPGVSAVFKGGVVTYWNETKSALLGVSSELLSQKGPVCQEVAEAMAQGARAALHCDLAVATTGVAGPGPDELGNPQGLVYVALAAPDGVWCRRTCLTGPRDRVRARAAHHAFDLARRWLGGLPMEHQP